MDDPKYGLSAREWRMLRRLKTPAGIQRLLNSLAYHDADTAWSPRRVLREGVAHCAEGGILAAAALRVLYGEMAQVVTTGARVLPRRLQEAGYRFAYPELDPALRDLLG